MQYIHIVVCYTLITIYSVIHKLTQYIQMNYRTKKVRLLLSFKNSKRRISLIKIQDFIFRLNKICFVTERVVLFIYICK